MEKLKTISEINSEIFDEPRFRKEILEEWALSIINKAAGLCIPDGNPMNAKQNILALIKEL